MVEALYHASKGCGFNPQSGHTPRVGHILEAVSVIVLSHIDASFSLSKINKNIFSGEDKKEKNSHAFNILRFFPRIFMNKYDTLLIILSLC